MKKKPESAKPVDKRSTVREAISKDPPKTGARGAPAGLAGKSPGQIEAFTAAMRLFHARRFAEARDAFTKAMDGPGREIAHKAELHKRMCEQRLGTPAVDLKSSEDHYNYAVALINLRDLARAEQHLSAALGMDSNADHFYYAMALCRGLSGDLDGAYENLKRAIELQPRNRILARQDADFAPLSHQPPLDQLIYPEKARY